MQSFKIFAEKDKVKAEILLNLKTSMFSFDNSLKKPISETHQLFLGGMFSRTLKLLEI